MINYMNPAFIKAGHHCSGSCFSKFVGVVALRKFVGVVLLSSGLAFLNLTLFSYSGRQ